MNTIVQSSFDSLETALSNLVESIASYNPSPAAASAVVIADNGVAESLEFRTFVPLVRSGAGCVLTIGLLL